MHCWMVSATLACCSFGDCIADFVCLDKFRGQCFFFFF